MQSLHQDEIIKLEDSDLQLRYILGGLYPHGNLNCNRYFGCFIRCSTQPVEDDERFQKVKEFIRNHNVSNSTFLRLAFSYLFGSFNSFRGDYGSLIPELERTILEYEFTHTNAERFKENSLKEKEILKLLLKEGSIEGTSLNSFLRKYSLSAVDFIILAKTSINYKYKVGRGFEVTDLPKDLKDILECNSLYQPQEWVEAYRDSLEEEISEKNKSLIKKVGEKFTKKDY